MKPVTITDVRQQPSGQWIITDSAQTKYATRDALRASLADRYRQSGQRVWIDSGNGWHYRVLWSIMPAKERPAAILAGMPPVQTTVPDEPVCPKYGARCRWQYVSATTMKCSRPTCGAIKRAENGFGYR